MKSIIDNRKFDPVILFLCIINIAIHLVFINNLEYHRDELLYFSLGQHPAFGYATVPPMIGWIAWLMQNIFGYSLFAVRFFPAVMSGIMVLIVSAIAKELGGSRYSTILAATGMIISIFGLRTFELFQPVHLDLIFWTISIYLVIRYINMPSDKILIWFGVFAGLSLLNKYMIALLFFCFILIIPFTPLKTIFSNRKFWTGLLIGAIIFLPNVIWQFLNGLPVIGHLSELQSTQLVNVDRVGFLIEQIIMPGTASVLTIAGLLYLLFYKSVVKFRFMGIIAVLVIFTLMMLKGKSYYTLGIFPFLIAAGAVIAEKYFKKTLSQVFLLLLLIILTIPVLPIGIPVLKTKGLLSYFKVLSDKYKIDIGRRWEDGSIHSLPQDYADMLGWEELTSLADKAYQIVPDKKFCFIYGENYGQAGAITIIGKKYKLPEAICFSESFRYWIPLKFYPDPTSLIYINDQPGEDIKRLFGRITKIGSVSNPEAREFGTSIYLCQEPVTSFNRFWSEKVVQLNK